MKKPDLTLLKLSFESEPGNIFIVELSNRHDYACHVVRAESLEDATRKAKEILGLSGSDVYIYAPGFDENGICTITERAW